MNPDVAKKHLPSHHKYYNYMVRQGGLLVSFGVYVSLFAGKLNLATWILIAFIHFVYPLLPLFTNHTRTKGKFFLLFDNLIYGYSLGVWGFNPYLITIFMSGCCLINVSYQGLKYLSVTFAISTVALLMGAFTIGFDYRPILPQPAFILASLGLIIFMYLIGIRVYRINTRLRKARAELEHQKQELTNLNRT